MRAGRCAGRRARSRRRRLATSLAPRPSAPAAASASSRLNAPPRQVRALEQADKEIVGLEAEQRREEAGAAEQQQASPGPPAATGRPGTSGTTTGSAGSGSITAMRPGSICAGSSSNGATGRRPVIAGDRRAAPRAPGRGGCAAACPRPAAAGGAARSRESGSGPRVQSSSAGRSGGISPGNSTVSRFSPLRMPRTQDSAWPWCSVRTTSVERSAASETKAGLMPSKRALPAASLDHLLEQQAEVVVLVVGDVVGLAGREQQNLDARPEQPREQAARAVAEAAQHGRERRLDVVEAGPAAIEGAEQVDQHDLAIEAAEVVAIEAAHHGVAIALVALGHERGQAAARSPRPPESRLRRQGAELQELAAGEVARHGEAPGLDPAQARLGLAALEIAGVQRRSVRRLHRRRPAPPDRALPGNSASPWRARRAAAARPRPGSAPTSRRSSARAGAGPAATRPDSR